MPQQMSSNDLDCGLYLVEVFRRLAKNQEAPVFQEKGIQELRNSMLFTRQRILEFIKQVFLLGETPDNQGVKNIFE